MFCQRSLFKVGTSLLFLYLGITAALFPSGGTAVNAVNAQGGSQENESDHSAIVIDRKPQRVFAPHWTTEGDFSTTIYIRNVHIAQALTAKVSLVLDHRTVTLPDTFVDSLQTVALDVRNALIDNGEKAEQSGGAVIDFEAESAGAVNAYAQVLDTARSISFSFPFMQDGSPASGPLDAVALYYGKGADASIALQNTREIETTAAVSIFVSGRAISLGKRLLKPREVTVIKLPTVEGLVPETGPHSAGVRVEYEGKPGSVIAQGWVADESIGFSAPFAFHPKSNCGCADDTQHKYGTGIMIGKGGMAQPGAGQSSGIIFSPYLALSNSSEKALTVSPVFSYDAKDKVEQVTLPAMTLGPKQSAVVNLREFQQQGIIPSSVEMGNVDLQYKGEAGALIAELASVDQDGSFVSPVPLICNGSQGSHMSFWRTDGDWHSSVTIENIASDENDVEITIGYPGGVYVVEKRIAAGETTMVSINEIQQSQEPDGQGHVIPLNALLGGANVRSRNLSNGLVINAMLVNPTSRTCGSCGGLTWVQYFSVSDKQAFTGTSLYSGFDPHTIGLGFQIYINVHNSDGTQNPETPYSSTSSNGSVASAGSSYVTPISPGTTTITANSRVAYFTDSACSRPNQLLPSPSATLTVVPQVTFQKSDGAALPNPLRVGITATTLGGIVHNRTQHLKAVITPANQASNVTITSNNKLTVTQGSSSNGVINFDVVGKTKSADHGDATIKANYSGMVIATAAVDVLVPNNVSATHDTIGGGVVVANRALDAATSPGIIGLPPGQVQLSTIYVRFLTITVCDQFGGLSGDLYQGSEVSELADDGIYHSINQFLTSTSTYLDPVGAAAGQATAAAGSSAANNWPSQARIPAPAGCVTPPTPQNLAVRIDGFGLSPSVANRNWTLCGDGVSTTSPPVTLTISWP